MLSLILLSSLLLAVLGDNTDPVVLVHGIAAQPAYWGRYKGEFEAVGLPTVAVDIGQFTSAHERAAEVYAHLKGTVTDFGVCRSREFGHERFGKDFRGQALFPEWDENNRAHFVGHSYGGTTILLLEKLLREGSGCPEDTSPLYTGGNKNWITSVTTFSGVLSGTSLIDNFEDLNVLDLLEFFVIFFGGLVDDTFIELVLEVDFAHWGVSKQPDESIPEFFFRIKDSQLLSDDNTAISTYDLSKKGAREINAFGKLAYPETYYYAFAVERTNPFRNCFLFVCSEQYQVPSPFMNLLFHPFALIMGSLDTAAEERENDGLVNWVNQICPIVTEADRSACSEFTGNWVPGKWFYQDVNNLDHLSVYIGELPLLDDARPLYKAQAARLRALPSN